jgi:hypothetical protein
LSGCASGDDAPSYQVPDGGWPIVNADGGLLPAALGGMTGGAWAPVPDAGSGIAATAGAGGVAAGAAPGGTLPVNPGATGTAGGAGAIGGLFGGLAGGGGSGAIGGLLGGLAGGGGAGGILGGLGGLTGGGGGGTPAPPLDPSVKQPAANKLPQVTGTCPNLVDGTVTVAGAKVQIWVGSKPGPAYFYFHGTGTSPDEVNQGLPGATAGVKTNGGLVASWDTSNNKGSNTGTIWYTGDLEGVDQLVACGVQKGIIDTGRIHAAGYSAGGLETGAALFSRSNYMASGIVYSGGHPFGAGGLQDPSNVPAMLGAHGAQGSDSLGLDFHDNTIAMENEIKKAGGFAMDCDDGGDHIVGWLSDRAGVGGKAMQFLKDHPYNTRPSPYASGLPAGFPSYCKVVP